MVMAPPKAGTRGDLHKPEGRVALEAPYQRDQRASVERKADKGVMPKSIGALLNWYATLWDGEVPERLHVIEVYHARQETDPRTGEKRWPKELVGGSQLGSHGWSDQFRRYMESYASEVDVDGYYLRPCHAALARLATRDHWMARNLFAVAQAGYDWKGVADRAHWVHGMYLVYIEEALRRLWREYEDQALRLQ
jgi:hypothetical protein